MAEIDTGLDSPSAQPGQDAYLAACSALLLAIATGDVLTNEQRAVLIEAMPDAELRLNLACGLDVYGLVETTDDQAGK